MSDHSNRLAVGVALLLAWGGCRNDANKPLGPADSYILFAPVAGKADGALPVVRRLDINDESVKPIPYLLEASFPFEMVRTTYLVKQFVRDATVDGQPFSAVARRNAEEPTCMVLGIERWPYGLGLGLSLSKFFDGVQSRPRLPWIGVPADPARDKALVQTLTGRLATYVAHFVATAGRLSDGAAPPPILVEAYRIAMEGVHPPKRRRFDGGIGPKFGRKSLAWTRMPCQRTSGRKSAGAPQQRVKCWMNLRPVA